MIRRYWRRFFNQGGIRTWAHEPVVRQAINRRITGSPDVWPIEWFADWLARRRGGTRRHPEFARALSLGCGDGALERDLEAKALCEQIVGVDISSEALEMARRRAREAGCSSVVYRTGDLDRLVVERESFDGIFAHQALHHVHNLEGCLEQVAGALTAEGLVYLDEYVGPSRADWCRELMVVAEDIYQQLPARARRRKRLQLPVDWRDPSEAIRSAEIVPLVAERFDVIERRDYGGNLLAVIHPHLALDRLSREAADDLLMTLLVHEDRMLAAGDTSYYTVIVARRRTAATAGSTGEEMRTPVPAPAGG